MPILALIASVGLALAAAADEPGVLVERLDDPDWGVREGATAALMQTDEVPGEAIEAALRRDDLSPEQRVRLIRVAATRFRFAPLGGLGVSFGQGGEGGVSINGVVPGFPAADLLRAGDVILMIGDNPVAGQDHLRAEILSRRPGESMPVLVRRDRTILDLDLPLGSYNNLDGAAALDESTVRQAMRLRYERSGIAWPEPDAVGGGLTASAWIDAAFPDGRDGVENQPGDRRGPGVADARRGLDRELSGRRRGIWTTRAEAERGVGDQLRADMGRAITAGVRQRSVLVEFERSLSERLRAAEERGEDTESLAARLEGVRERMRGLDRELIETTRAMDALRP